MQKITEELNFSTRAPVLKYQARKVLYDKEVMRGSVASSYQIEKAKENFVAPSAEIEKQINNLPRRIMGPIYQI